MTKSRTIGLLLGSLLLLSPTPLASESGTVESTGAGSLGPAESSCIPAGGSTTLSFNLPANGVGLPTSTKLLPNTSEAFDNDFWSSPDSMGPAKFLPPNPSTGYAGGFLLPVSNHGGNIVGPNGAIVEGGLEGECVEIEVCIDYVYVVSITVCFTNAASVGLPGTGLSSGGSYCKEIEVKCKGTYCTPEIEVCPC